MNNRDYIAAYQARRRYPGQAAARTEVLLTCPCCGVANFSSRGLSAHCCRAKPGRERLTGAEIALAHERAGAPAPVSLP